MSSASAQKCGRRPEEDDEEERERRQRERAGSGRPADERWHGARRAADDDVLRRRALEPARVDEHVEEVAHEGEHGRQDVHRAGEQRERERRQREAELERVLGREAVRRHGAPARALAHQPVDVAVEHVVEGARAAAREGEPDHRGDGDVPRRQAAGACHEAAEAGDEEQRHDARLRERHVVAHGAERRPLLAMHECRQHECRRQRRGGQGEVDSRRGHESRDAEQAERHQRVRQQRTVAEPGADHERRQRRQRQRREHVMGRAERRRRRRRRPAAPLPPPTATAISARG